MTGFTIKVLDENHVYLEFVTYWGLDRRTCPKRNIYDYLIFHDKSPSLFYTRKTLVCVPWSCLKRSSIFASRSVDSFLSGCVSDESLSAIVLWNTNQTLQLKWARFFITKSINAQRPVRWLKDTEAWIFLLYSSHAKHRNSDDLFCFRRTNWSDYAMRNLKIYLNSSWSFRDQLFNVLKCSS